MRKHGEVRELEPRAIRRLLAARARNGCVLGGIAALAVSFYSLLMLLSFTALSFAVPATAASYILETLLARFILKEQVGWSRWAGAWLVAGGVALLAL